MRMGKIIAFGLQHQVLSTLGVIIVTSASFYSVKPILSLVMDSEGLRRDTALLLPFFPMQASVALVIGFALGRRQTAFGRTLPARLVWIIPLAWLLLLMGAWRPSLLNPGDMWHHFFWNRSWSSVKIQLITTLPFITSAAYATGNWIALAGGLGKAD